MSPAAKPYRRYRARGGDSDGADGLDALRALREEGGGAQAPAPARRPPERPLRPSRGERRRRRAQTRAGRPWWSLRGLGPGGWTARVALVLLVALVAWAGLGYWALDRGVSEANGKVTPGARAALDDPPGGLLGTPTNILVIGADALRGQTRSRADTILIMRTDPDAGRIRYLSIPRDWRVELPGRGVQKINAALFYGGQRAMIRAVKRLTGVPIHHLMLIKFRGFERMVNGLGGVTVSNPSPLVDCPYSGGRTVSFPQGRLRLDGERALEFVRARQGACGGDLARALRQQAVLAAMKDRVLAPANLWAAPWRGGSAVRALHTDMGTIDMIKFGWLQARLDQREEDRILLTGEPQVIGGISFIVGTDPDLNEREIARFMGA